MLKNTGQAWEIPNLGCSLHLITQTTFGPYGPFFYAYPLPEPAQKVYNKHMLHSDGAYRGAHTAHGRRPGSENRRFSLPCRYAVWLNIPLTLMLSVVIWFLTMQAAPVIPLTFFTTPLLGLLNWLPVVLVLGAGVFLFGNVFSAAAVTLFLFGLLNFANRMKIDARDDPLVLQDLTMVREAVQAAGGYDLSVDWKAVGLCLLALATLIVCAVLFRTRPLKLPRAGRYAGRLAGCVALLGTLIALTPTVYTSADIFAGFPITNRFNMTTVYEQAGFNYSFLHTATAYSVQKPKGFDKAATEQRIAATEVQAADPKRVHVIFVMSEAFCDITNNDAFDWSPGNDPLEHFNALKRSEHAISGRLIVPNYGGGTANTEFDVLTGMQTALLSETGISSFRALHKNIGSIFRTAEESGWQTQFIHPGKAWFYNRQNIYRYLGAQEIVFEDAFADATQRGGYVSDASLTDYMIADFEKHKNDEAPLFSYVTTIQNHMAYTESKYGKAVDLPQLELTREISDEAKTMLTVYTSGVRDADAMLGRLTAYYEQQDEPVLLLFYGDHLPSLGEDYLCYRALGIDMGAALDAYAPPYLLWTNSAGAQVLDFETLPARIGLTPNGNLSASFLGEAVLHAIGLGMDDPFFSFVDQVRRALPVVQRGAAVDAAGIYHEQIPEEKAALVQQYQDRIYYRMKYETIEG